MVIIVYVIIGSIFLISLLFLGGYLVLKDRKQKKILNWFQKNTTAYLIYGEDINSITPMAHYDHLTIEIIWVTAEQETFLKIINPNIRMLSIRESTDPLIYLIEKLNLQIPK